jgi:hypothetical protein
VRNAFQKEFWFFSSGMITSSKVEGKEPPLKADVEIPGS